MQFETYLLLLILLFLLIIILVHDAMLSNYKSQVLYVSSQVTEVGSVDYYGVATVITGNPALLGTDTKGILPSFTLERGEQRMRMSGQFVLDLAIQEGSSFNNGDGSVLGLTVLQSDARSGDTPVGTTHMLTKVTNYPIVVGEITTIRIPFTTEKADWDKPQSIGLGDINGTFAGKFITDNSSGPGVCVYKASFWYY